MCQGFHYGLVSVTTSSEGHDMRVIMVVAKKMHLTAAIKARDEL